MSKIDWEGELVRLLRDAERWRKLIRLCGSTKDGSQTQVTLAQDDATYTSFIQVGKKSYFAYDRCSFEATIDSISELE